MSLYKANVRDLEFNLFEVLDREKVLATGEFGDLDGDTKRPHAWPRGRWPSRSPRATATRAPSIHRRTR
jgi:hypothetical protein